ncbi:MAG: precorrin-3B C(17)-methyltransferase [Caldanaerobacter sp.]
MGWLKIVGIGPGSLDDMTQRALQALEECDVVVGYKTYIDLVMPLIEKKKIVSSGMRSEVERCRKAIELSLKGEKVCLISSGDPGIYGMAGLVYEIAGSEVLEEMDVEVIPGVTALNAASAILGAPIMQDFSAISLSDHLIPWEVIEKRLEASAKADFVVVLYNPKSRERQEHIEKAKKILLKYRKEDTPVGIVKNATRRGEEVVLTTLKDMEKFDIDMRTIVIVGNSSTYVKNGKMITPRGYRL